MLEDQALVWRPLLVLFPTDMGYKSRIRKTKKGSDMSFISRFHNFRQICHPDWSDFDLTSCTSSFDEDLLSFGETMRAHFYNQLNYKRTVCPSLLFNSTNPCVDFLNERSTTLNRNESFNNQENVGFSFLFSNVFFFPVKWSQTLKKVWDFSHPKNSDSKKIGD